MDILRSKIGPRLVQCIIISMDLFINNKILNIENLRPTVSFKLERGPTWSYHGKKIVWHGLSIRNLLKIFVTLCWFNPESTEL